MSEKKCFSVIHCTLRSRCEAASRNYENGYFSPQNVDEHCDHFREMPEREPEGLIEKLYRMAGAHK